MGEVGVRLECRAEHEADDKRSERIAKPTQCKADEAEDNDFYHGKELEIGEKWPAY